MIQRFLSNHHLFTIRVDESKLLKTFLKGTFVDTLFPPPLYDVLPWILSPFFPTYSHNPCMKFDVKIINVLGHHLRKSGIQIQELNHFFEKPW